MEDTFCCPVKNNNNSKRLYKDDIVMMYHKLLKILNSFFLLLARVDFFENTGPFKYSLGLSNLIQGHNIVMSSENKSR